MNVCRVLNHNELPRMFTWIGCNVSAYECISAILQTFQHVTKTMECLPAREQTFVHTCSISCPDRIYWSHGCNHCLMVVKWRILKMWQWGHVFPSTVCLCVHAGLPTYSPGTGPVLPSSLWPVTPRQLAKLTCTVASSLCSTLRPPTMCGQRTSTCVSTLPWTWVRLDMLSIS